MGGCVAPGCTQEWRCSCVLALSLEEEPQSLSRTLFQGLLPAPTSLIKGSSLSAPSTLTVTFCSSLPLGCAFLQFLFVSASSFALWPSPPPWHSLPVVCYLHFFIHTPSRTVVSLQAGATKSWNSDCSSPTLCWVFLALTGERVENTGAPDLSPCLSSSSGAEDWRGPRLPLVWLRYWGTLGFQIIRGLGKDGQGWAPLAGAQRRQGRGGGELSALHPSLQTLIGSIRVAIPFLLIC